MTLIKAVIFDLDNTLWDWLSIWNRGFEARIKGLESLLDKPRSEIFPEIKAINQQAGTSEYTLLLRDMPSVVKLLLDDPSLGSRIREIEHEFFAESKSATTLYPGVKETLAWLKGREVELIAYTDSITYWAIKRIKQTGLDGVFDEVFMSEDDSIPADVDIQKYRYYEDPSEYQLEFSRQYSVPREWRKPNPKIVRHILRERNLDSQQVLFVGDSLFKDVKMANEAGIRSVYAKYGDGRDAAEYEKLRQVSHWSDQHIQEDRSDEVRPTFTLPNGLSELTQLDVWPEK